MNADAWLFELLVALFLGGQVGIVGYIVWTELLNAGAVSQQASTEAPPTRPEATAGPERERSERAGTDEATPARVSHRSTDLW